MSEKCSELMHWGKDGVEGWGADFRGTLHSPWQGLVNPRLTSNLLGTRG